MLSATQSLTTTLRVPINGDGAKIHKEDVKRDLVVVGKRHDPTEFTYSDVE